MPRQSPVPPPSAPRAGWFLPREVAADCGAALIAAAREAKVWLSFDLPEAGVAVHADEERFRRIVLDLLGHAIRCNVAGGDAHLHVRVAGGSVEVRVRDSGPGMTAEQQSRLFEADAQVPETGFGLGVTRRTVEALGGTLAVRSWPSVGSEFVARFPAAPDDVPGVADRES